MIRAIAWRNIWRSKIRSGVIIASVAVGLWGGLFVIALSKGMSEQRKEKVIYEQISHIQIHDPEYSRRHEIQYFIPNGPEVINQLQQDSSIAVVGGRTLINGFLTAPRGAQGVRITGIEPANEQRLTNLSKNIVEGNYLSDSVNNRIIIGKALADKLGLKLGSKIVLTFQDTAANMIAGAFRIGGIFKTVDVQMDERIVYVNAKDLQHLMGNDKLWIHEIAILMKNPEDVWAKDKSLAKVYPNLKVETWKEISPELQYLDEMMDMFLYFMIGIILLALAFGLINTMLMAVLERVRELGMLMAIGMDKRKIFFMVVIETIMLAFTGAFLGFILGAGTIYLTSQSGINLSILQQGMEEFGLDAVLYPSLNWYYYPVIGIMVVVFAVLSSIYPAIKALQLNPVQAIRKI